MNDLEEKIWKILGRRQIAALATITDESAPWVRYVTIESGPDFVLSFCTSRGSRKARQMADNSAVHLTCGILQPPDDSSFLQIVGRAEIRSDAVTRSAYWQDGWQRYFSGPDDPDYVMIFIHPIRIEYNGPGSFVPMVWEGKIAE